MFEATRYWERWLKLLPGWVYQVSVVDTSVPPGFHRVFLNRVVQDWTINKCTPDTQNSHIRKETHKPPSHHFCCLCWACNLEFAHPRVCSPNLGAAAQDPKERIIFPKLPLVGAVVSFSIHGQSTYPHVRYPNEK